MSNELQVIDLAAPQKALEAAKIVQKFVNDMGLTVDIQGRKYPLVESWQFAGSQFGLYPILVECKNESSYADRHFKWSDRRNNPKEKKTQHFKYRAVVEIRRYSDDKVFSRGSMVCTNDEFGKHEFAEYAIESMAQTRAEGKAWRMLLAWIMKAAGFEQTPAEEMEEQREFYENCPTPQEKTALIKLAYSAKMDDEKREEALALIAGCTNYQLFKKIEDRLRILQPTIDDIVNPNQADIAEAVRNRVNHPNT
jgi:hypothetical protein